MPFAEDIAGRTGARITLTEDPAQAVAGVDFIHTDVWVSMGEAKDVWAERVRVLAPYQVNAGLLRQAGNPAVKFMHCLPAFRDPNTTVEREIMEHTGMTAGAVGADQLPGVIRIRGGASRPGSPSPRPGAGRR